VLGAAVQLKMRFGGIKAQARSMHFFMVKPTYHISRSNQVQFVDLDTLGKVN